MMITPPAVVQCAPSRHNPLITKIQLATEGSTRLGFYKPDDASVPPAIKAAAESTFQIVMPGGEKVKIGMILGPGHSLEDIIQYVGTLPIDRLERLALQYQVRTCAAKPQPMQCEIFGGTITGSAYLSGDGTTLRTALHNVHDYAVDHVQRAGPPRQDVDLPLFVFDAKGRPVVVPPNGKATASISVQDLLAPGQSGNGFSAPNHDGVEIKLSKSLGRPIPQATSAPKSGDRVYLPSYPIKTEDRAPYGAPDSPGFQLRVSSGSVLSQAEVARRMGLTPDALTAESKAFLGDLIATNVDGAPHSSGAPLINERGEVLGTYTAGNPADGQASKNRVSYSSDGTKRRIGRSSLRSEPRYAHSNTSPIRTARPSAVPRPNAFSKTQTTVDPK